MSTASPCCGGGRARGQLRRAAAALHHTPSAVSQQIAALERGAGITLVERSTRGVTLTDAGRALLATADAIHAELQAAARRLRDLTAEGPQALTVVTFPSAGEPLLAPALTAMTAAADYPVEITVIEAEPAEALGSVRDGRADLALVYHFHTAAMPRAWPPPPVLAATSRSSPTISGCWFPQATRWRPAGRSPAEFACECWIQGWGDTGDVVDMLAAPAVSIPCRLPLQRLPLHERPRRRPRRVARAPSLALTGDPQVRDVQIAPQPTRYIGAWLPRRHQPNPAAERLLAALRARAQPA